jgi:hypothetical protein
VTDLHDAQVADDVLAHHMLRKTFLGAVLADLIKEVGEACKNLSLWIVGKERSEIIGICSTALPSLRRT